MRIVGRKVIDTFKRKHADSRSSLNYWYRVVSTREWRDFAELRQVFSSADHVASHVVFNIGGNKYRLVADVNYKAGMLLVREVLTHQEHDRGGWKKS